LAKKEKGGTITKVPYSICLHGEFGKLGLRFIISYRCILSNSLCHLQSEQGGKVNKLMGSNTCGTKDGAPIRVPSDVIEKGAHIKRPDLTPVKNPATSTPPANTGNTSGNSGKNNQ
jgi:hypothetical protein